MTSISVPSSRPLEPQKLAALRKVAATASLRGVAPPMLVGAFARDIWFWHVHGVETERATEDVDISIELPNWQGFRDFVTGLREAGFRQPVPTHPEKLLDEETGQKLDVLPFGRLSDDGRAIVWPSDQSRWSILGFAESYQAAPFLALDADLPQGLRIVTLPAMVTLKLVSFYERLVDRKRKDGADISFTMTHYLAAGTQTRLAAGVDADIMDRVEGDLQRAAAMLLGRDMGAILSSVTQSVIAKHLRRETAGSSECPLARELARNGTQGEFQRARVLLQDLLAGLDQELKT